MASPVVQHLGNMVNLPGCFRAPEYEIIILGAVKLLAESPNPLKQVLPDHEEMADIIHAGKQVRVKVRLEMRVKQSLSVHVQLVLIRVYDLAARMFMNGFYHLIKSMGRKGIVMVGQNHEITPGHIQGSIGIACNPPVTSQNLITDALIPVSVSLKDALQALSPGAAVRNAYLPVGVCLVHNGIQHFPEITLRRLIGRYHHGQQGFKIKYLLALRCQFLIRGSCKVIPLAVIIVIVNSLKLVL